MPGDLSCIRLSVFVCVLCYDGYVEPKNPGLNLVGIVARGIGSGMDLV